MQDVLLKVYKVLTGSKHVTQKIKGIYNNPRAPDKCRETFPRITMFEILNTDADAADDKVIMNDVRIRIDIWSKSNNLFELSAAVKAEIEKNFELCRVDLQSDMYEDDSHIYHKPINIRIKTEV